MHSGPLRIVSLALLGLHVVNGFAAQHSDSAGIAALVSRAALAMRIDPEESRGAALEALTLLQRHPDVELEIRARLVLCEYSAERDATRTEEQLAAIERLLPQTQRTGLRAGLFNCRGELLETGGDNGRARDQYEQAVSTAELADDKEMLAGALFSRGYLLGLQGDYARGLVDLRRAQSLFEELDMPHHALTVLNSIAITYNRMGDYAQAQSIYSRALSAQRAAGMRREEAVTLSNLGRAAENLEQWSQARTAFQSSLDVSRSLNYPRGEAYALRGLASIANAEGNPEAALTSLDAAESLQQQTLDSRLSAQIQLARGAALRALGRLKEARVALLPALEVFRKGDMLGELASVYNELASVDAALADWRRAYQWKQDAKLTTERLLRNQIDQRFATLKVEFDTATKEKENAALMSSNSANELALAQTQRARSLQAAVIVLTGALALLLATLALHQRRSSLRMRRLAMTDDLTDVPNRRAVLRRLHPLLDQPTGQGTAVLILDIDHFKSINDSFGHAAGDKVLKAVATRLKAVLPEPEFFGRIGGEEFLIVLPATGLDQAMAKAEVLRFEISAIDTQPLCAEKRVITASIGVTESVPGDTTSHVLQRADAALYAAKNAGRNRVMAEAAP